MFKTIIPHNKILFDHQFKRLSAYHIWRHPVVNSSVVEQKLLSTALEGCCSFVKGPAPQSSLTSGNDKIVK